MYNDWNNPTNNNIYYSYRFISLMYQCYVFTLLFTQFTYSYGTAYLLLILYTKFDDLLLIIINKKYQDYYLFYELNEKKKT